MKYFFERNLFFSTLVKSRTSSPEVVCNREAVGKCPVVFPHLDLENSGKTKSNKNINAPTHTHTHRIK